MICLKFLEAQGELTLEDILERNCYDNFIIRAFQDKYLLSEPNAWKFYKRLKRIYGFIINGLLNIINLLGHHKILRLLKCG